MAVELGEVRLQKVHRIRTLEAARLVHHRVPGLEGHAVQDLGRDSVRLSIEGIFFGPSAGAALERLRAMHRAREPVDFLAELVGSSYFAEVVLERLDVWQSAEEPDQFSFALTVREHVAELGAPEDLTDLEAALRDEADTFLYVATLPELLKLGSIPEITDPLAPLSRAVEEIDEATRGLRDVASDLKTLLGAG